MKKEQLLIIYNDLIYFDVKSNSFKLYKFVKNIDIDSQLTTLKGTIGNTFCNDTDIYIKSHTLTDYSDFVESVRNEHNVKCNKELRILKKNGVFIIFRKHRHNSGNNDIKFILAYKPENKEVETEIESIFQLNNNVRVLNANAANHYSLILHPDVYGILLSAANIRSRGEQLFNKYKLKSKSGKIRNIVAPNPEHKYYLQRLNTLLQNTYDNINSDFQVAYKRGKNILSNSTRHRDKEYVLNIDLSDFFPSCKRELVSKYIDFLFKGMSINVKTKERFLDTILLDDGLFIGSPISGTLANAIISKPVSYMKQICAKNDVEFSVYADDMSFSSDRFINKGYVSGVFKRAFDEYNMTEYFTLNPKKFKGGSKTSRHITGVSFDDMSRTTGRRIMYRSIRGQICNLANGAKDINIQKLRGQIAFMLMLEEGDKLKRYLNKFSTTVETYNLCSKEKYMGV